MNDAILQREQYISGQKVRVEFARERDFRGRDRPGRGTAPGPSTNYRIVVENLPFR